MSKMPMVVQTGPWIKITAKNWPPGEVIKKDRDASRWFNSRFTTSRSLPYVLSYFLTTGWPPDALDDFLDAIVPKAGWSDSEQYNIRMPMSPDNRRERNQYGSNFMALLHGYWRPSK